VTHDKWLYRDLIVNVTCPSLAMSESKGHPLGLATDLLHADDEFHGAEVSPSISVTTSLLFYFFFISDGCDPGRQLSGRRNPQGSPMKTP